MKVTFAPLIILLFIAIQSISQETKKVVERPRDKYSSMEVKYYVLKSNRDIKHGPYMYSNNGKLFTSGFYKNGKKDSVWQRFTMEGKVITKKSYTDDKRTGVWEFYNNKGGIDWQYDFNNDSAVRMPHGMNGYVYLADNGRWVDAKVDRDPVRLSSKYEWEYFLTRNLRYPMESINQRQQGKGVVDVTVDETGNVIDYSISPESDYPLLGEEALRIVKLFDPEFLPAEKDGKKVKIRLPIAVQFRLGS